MKTRDARLKENQHLFRTANERLEGMVEDKVPAQDRVPFLCECLDAECTDSVSLTLDLYKHVRSYPNRFVIVSGHPTVTGERVVAAGDGYQIVEKGHDG